jgi:hypothetical protein
LRVVVEQGHIFHAVHVVRIDRQRLVEEPNRFIRDLEILR